MKFTVERAVPVKMLELVGKKTPTQKRRDKSVRLSACAARVFVEANDSTAGIEALVLEDGTCLLPYDHFLKLLKSHAPRINISMEANETAIRFATTALPVTEYSSAVKPPGQFQRFTASDVSELRPTSKPRIQTAPVPKPPQAGPSPLFPPGTRIWWRDDENWSQGLVNLTRCLCSLRDVSPSQLVGLARALYALERLPQVTPGVSVEVSMGYREEEEPEGRWLVRAGLFLISDSCVRCSWYSGGGASAKECDEAVTIAYEKSAQGERFWLEPDEDAYCRLVGWFEAVKVLVDNASSPIFELTVNDESGPDCVPAAKARQ